MAKMLAKLFEALRSIGIDEKVAQAAAEEAAGVDEKVAELKASFADLRADVRIFQAVTGIVVAVLLALVWQVFSLGGTVNRLDERMIGFDKRLGTVETKLASIESNLSEIRGLLTQRPPTPPVISPTPNPQDRSELPPNVAEGGGDALSAWKKVTGEQPKPEFQFRPAYDQKSPVFKDAVGKGVIDVPGL